MTPEEVTLRDYLESKLNGMEQRINLHFELNELAINKATERNDQRLESMNEFRDSLKDQAAHFVTKEELSLLLKSLDDKILGLLKIVYGGLGIAIFLQVAIPIAIKVIGR